MAPKLNIGLLMGSTRDERMCDRVKQFVQTAVEKDHKVSIFDPTAIDLPKSQQSVNFIYDPTASNVPQNIKDLNEEIKSMDGFIIICPEYNWSLPPGLTNMMDNIPPMSWCWKPCTYVHYSMSPVGGWRVGMQLRVFTGALGLITVPKQMGIAMVQTALTADGKSTNKATDAELKITLNHLYWAIQALKGHTTTNVPPSWSM